MTNKSAIFTDDWHKRAALTPAEVVALTGSSRPFIYREIAEGRLMAIRCGKRKLVVPVAALEKYLEG